MMGVQRTFRVLVVALLAILLITTGCSQKTDQPQTTADKPGRKAVAATVIPEATATPAPSGEATSPKLPDIGDIIVLKKKCQMTRWSDIRVRDYTVVRQDDERVVLGTNIYRTTLDMPKRGSGERYLAVYTGKPLDGLKWKGKTYDNFYSWTIGSEAPPVWEDGGVTVFVVPKEMLASEYWKEIKVVWSDLSLDQTGTDLGL